MDYLIVIKYTFSIDWLKKSRNERSRAQQEWSEKSLKKYEKFLKIDFVDCEAFHADFSDMMVIRTKDLKKYYFFIEELRDSVFVLEELIKIDDINIGIIDGYREFERDNK